MKVQQQLNLLRDFSPSFKERMDQIQQIPITTNDLEILQLNVGRKCNLYCKHCHVEAGPNREELMSIDILKKCITMLKNSNISTLDITGGAPEMNQNLAWFLSEITPITQRVIVRSNLVILKDPEYQKFLDIYPRYKTEICASLPHYSKEISERQRGCGSFTDTVDIIRQLNNLGYGKEGSGLILDLVHNPVGCFLPGNQKALELEYKEKLFNQAGIQFNTLFSITNMPLGRFLEFLVKTDNFDDYMMDLIQAFNPCAAQNVMCKNTLSVAWDGTLYNCDFNQMLQLEGKFKGSNTIMDFKAKNFKEQTITIQNHCYGCTAGSGSSCQGAVSD